MNGVTLMLLLSFPFTSFSPLFLTVFLYVAQSGLQLESLPASISQIQGMCHCADVITLPFSALASWIYEHWISKKQHRVLTQNIWEDIIQACKVMAPISCQNYVFRGPVHIYESSIMKNMIKKNLI